MKLFIKSLYKAINNNFHRYKMFVLLFSLYDFSEINIIHPYHFQGREIANNNFKIKKVIVKCWLLCVAGVSYYQCYYHCFSFYLLFMSLLCCEMFVVDNQFEFDGNKSWRINNDIRGFFAIHVKEIFIHGVWLCRYI